MKDFLDEVKQSITTGSFVKLTLSKPSVKQSDLTNVYIRPVRLKNESCLSFTYKYKTNDQVKNFTLEESEEKIKSLIEGSFKNAALFTTHNNWSLQTSKKGKISILKSPPSLTQQEDISHDRTKTKRADSSKPYLHYLGITDKQGKVVPKMADKYRQINKYLEIIDGLISSTDMPENINVVDMGSGKGYLTFALYDYLQNTVKLQAQVTGIELRKELVDYCNLTAQQCGFEQLKFECQPIQEFDQGKIDILIALHACDTATDDAIAKGILSKAQLIICAPCCHKQIRQQVKGKEQESPLLKYGIFKERQFEMVTDTIRALIMEEHQYQSKIFEFVSNEHTRKNIMLVGVKSQTKKTEMCKIKIDSIKKEFQIQQHYLETLV